MDGLCSQWDRRDDRELSWNPTDSLNQMGISL
jgi:hypothetical protein